MEVSFNILEDYVITDYTYFFTIELDEEDGSTAPFTSRLMEVS